VTDLPFACTLNPDGMTARPALFDALVADGLLDRHRIAGAAAARP
jgi:hypothetical protein